MGPSCRTRPQRGLPDVNGPLGGAILKPRPLAEVDYNDVGAYDAAMTAEIKGLAEAGMAC
jgi:hypothetical protein